MEKCGILGHWCVTSRSLVVAALKPCSLSHLGSFCDRLEHSLLHFHPYLPVRSWAVLFPDLRLVATAKVCDQWACGQLHPATLFLWLVGDFPTWETFLPSFYTQKHIPVYCVGGGGGWGRGNSFFLLFWIFVFFCKRYFLKIVSKVKIYIQLFYERVKA